MVDFWVLSAARQGHGREASLLLLPLPSAPHQEVLVASSRSQPEGTVALVCDRTCLPAPRSVIKAGAPRGAPPPERLLRGVNTVTNRLADLRVLLRAAHPWVASELWVTHCRVGMVIMASPAHSCGDDRPGRFPTRTVVRTRHLVGVRCLRPSSPLGGAAPLCTFSIRVLIKGAFLWGWAPPSGRATGSCQHGLWLSCVQVVFCKSGS